MSATVSLSKDLTRIVVAIDPAVSANEDSDNTGIIVVARGPHIVLDPEHPCVIPHCPGHGFVLADRTCHVLPHEWARIAIEAYDEFKADRIVAEVNQGVEMVGETLHAVRVGIPFSAVHASRGKRLRAEPVAALYEQNRVHHLGVFQELEEEMNTWTPEDKKSPDRVDALVHGLTYLNLIGSQGSAFMAKWADELANPKTEEPPELKQLPRFSSETERKPAAQRCPRNPDRSGRHRYQNWPDGTAQCYYCQGYSPKSS